MPSNCEGEKVPNRDTIWMAWHDFTMSWACFEECPIVTWFRENVTRFSVC